MAGDEKCARESLPYAASGQGGCMMSTDHDAAGVVRRVFV